MKDAGTCSKCGGPVLRIPGVVVPKGVGNSINVGRTVFSAIEVTRYGCTECGYLEEWIDSPEDLAAIVRRYGESNLFCALHTRLSTKQVAALFAPLGLEIRERAAHEHEILGPWGSLTVNGESPVALYGHVRDVLDCVVAVLEPLRSADVGYVAECYGPDRKLIKVLRS